MSDPSRDVAPTLTQDHTPARPLPRWLFVAAAVGVIGVGIDLAQGPPANALPMTAVQPPALAALPLYGKPVAGVGDADALESGASVAAYDAPEQAAAVVQARLADDAVEPGASVAAYER